MSAVLDPLAAAVEAGESAGKYYGKLEIDGQFVVLKKGQRKQVWTEGMDTDGRQTELTFRINPLDCTGLTYMIERQLIANFGEWSRIVWPSLRDLGVKSLYDVRGKYVKAELVKSGESYTKADGTVVEKTTLKFHAIYDTEAEATAAWEAQFGGGSGSQASTPSNNSSAPQQAPANDAERQVALGFLPAIVNANKNDLSKLEQALAAMSPLNKYFTINSPEVQQLLAA